MHERKVDNFYAVNNFLKVLNFTFLITLGVNSENSGCVRTFFRQCNCRDCRSGNKLRRAKYQALEHVIKNGNAQRFDARLNSQFDEKSCIHKIRNHGVDRKYTAQTKSEIPSPQCWLVSLSLFLLSIHTLIESGY